MFTKQENSDIMVPGRTNGKKYWGDENYEKKDGT